jgi:hypothetical protein
MLNMKKDEEMKNGQGEDGEMKKDTAGKPDTLFEQEATQTSERKRETNRGNSKNTLPDQKRSEERTRQG